VTPEDSVFAILMASGFSRRFGGKNKLLEPFRGKPLAQYSLDLLSVAPGFKAVFLVTAFKDVEKLLEGRDRTKFFPVHNAAPEKGQRESIALGIEAADAAFPPQEGRERYYMFFPCDQPFLDRAALNLLLQARKPGRIVQPCYRGERGSPVLFSGRFRDELKALEAGMHGRDVIARHPDCVTRVEVFSPLTDIDSPLSFNQFVSVVGSGGKTTLIWKTALAKHKTDAAAKILVTPTTKMLVPPPNSGLYDFYFDAAVSKPLLPSIEARPGVTLAGSFNPSLQKLEALPSALLERAASDFDLVLCEADGSRQHPLKGWADYEPVVPPWTTTTVGVIPVWPLGHAASGELVHRLPLFEALTGVKEGEILRPEHLAAAIMGNKGLFSAAVGEKILYFSQIKDDTDREKAEKVAELL
jgi:probable selenium-dependent hydroxylase accessory protein YqeC